ncbi:uncharacterized protein LY89DRAFT_556265, partial [Mollisia scopiformis]
LVSAQLSLNRASSFAALSYASITNIGPSVLTGNVGTLGTSITGFFPPGVYTGTSYISTQADDAFSDAETVFLTIANYVGVDLSTQDLGGMTLGPGCYTFQSSAQLTGNLLLESGDAGNASWYFQIGSSLTTSGGSIVVLGENALACNVFWMVGSSATLGAGTGFQGAILAYDSIIMGSGAMSSGGLFALDGNVTLVDNDVQA